MNRIKLNIQKFASGSMSFANGNMSVLINWSSSVIGSTASEKAQNNKSNVSATIYVRRTDGYSTWGNFTGHININNVGFGFNTYASVSGDWVVLGSATLQVAHNNDGSKTIYIGGVVTGPTETSWEGKTASGGQNVGLDTISRMSSITSFVGLSDSQQRVDNVENEFKVEYTRYNVEFTDNLVIEYLDVDNTGNWTTIKTIENYVSGNSFSFTNTELQTLFSADTTNTENAISLRAYLKTYGGSSLIGDSNIVTFTSKIYDNNPVFNNFTFEDTNAKTVALTGDNTINVNNYSNIKATISSSNKAIALKGASITKYRFVIGSKTIDINYSDSEDVSGIINGAENGTYVVYAIDSRNNSTSVTKLATSVKDYTNLVRNTDYKAERDNGGIGGNVTLSFSGTIWNNNFGNVINSFTNAKYLLKKTDSNTWIDIGSSMTDITPTISGNTFSFSGLISSDNADTKWDLQSSYDIKVILEDKLSSVEFIVVLASAIPNISLAREGVGIMCDYDKTKGGLLQIGGEPYAMGDTLPIDTVVEYEGSTVPEGFELVEDYSTDEIKTNQVWINGKPIYRKVIKFTTSSSTGVWVDQNLNISNLDIDTLRITSAWVRINEGSQTNEYVPSKGFQLAANNGNLRYAMAEAKFASKQATIVLEYCKTTD